MQAGAVKVLQAIMDTGVENVATDRVKFVLTWLTVGADQDDFRAPQGEKTFEGRPILLSHMTGWHTHTCIGCIHRPDIGWRPLGWESLSWLCHVTVLSSVISPYGYLC